MVYGFDDKKNQIESIKEYDIVSEGIPNLDIGESIVANIYFGSGSTEKTIQAPNNTGYLIEKFVSQSGLTFFSVNGDNIDSRKLANYYIKSNNNAISLFPICGFATFDSMDTSLIYKSPYVRFRITRME